MLRDYFCLESSKRFNALDLAICFKRKDIVAKLIQLGVNIQPLRNERSAVKVIIDILRQKDELKSEFSFKIGQIGPEGPNLSCFYEGTVLDWVLTVFDWNHAQLSEEISRISIQHSPIFQIAQLLAKAGAPLPPKTTRIYSRYSLA